MEIPENRQSSPAIKCDRALLGKKLGQQQRLQKKNRQQKKEAQVRAAICLTSKEENEF